MKVLALIPARSGSKGLRNKNILPFQSKPLIAHTIQSALESKICQEVFVCTDSPLYASIAKEYGAEVPFLRSQESARDESKSIDCILESIQTYKQQGKTFDVLIFLQPTSPLRNSTHIKEAYEVFLNHHCQSLASVCEAKDHPLFIRSIQNNTLTPILHTPSDTRRQELQTFYRLNGAIYINLISTLTPTTSLNDNPIPYIMQAKHSLDIDTLQDYINLQKL